MRALEFKSKIKNNQILVPSKILSELKHNKDIRVIVLIEDSKSKNDSDFQKSAQSQFLNGYADADSIYDQN